MHSPLQVAAPVHGPPVWIEAGPRRIRLVGELDAFSGGAIVEELGDLAVARTSVVVDLTGLRVLTSGGLAVLEHCRDLAASRGNRFLLAAPRATMVQRVLDFAGVRHYVLQPHDEPRPPRQRSAPLP